MIKILIQFLLLGITLIMHVFPSSINDAEYFIAPEKVKLGISIAELKIIRPNLIDNYVLSSHADSEKSRYIAITEAIDLGQPSAISLCYLFSEDKLIGIQKTRNFESVSLSQRNFEASASYYTLTKLLGNPQQKPVLRTGEKSFVSVSADIWTPATSNLLFYFIATNKELSVSFMTKSILPMDEILIYPDPERFEIESKDIQTVTDLPRAEFITNLKTVNAEKILTYKNTGNIVLHNILYNLFFLICGVSVLGFVWLKARK